MKRWLAVAVFLLVLLSFQSIDTTRAEVLPQADVTAPAESYGGDAICLPGAYLQDPGDCRPLGPSSYLTRMAQDGLFLPLRPLPVAKPDPALNYMTDSYLVVGENAIPLYASLGDAMGRSASGVLDHGMKYLAVFDRVEEGGVVYYSTNRGWVEAGEAGASCCITTGRYQGLLFKETPRNSFGWIVDTAVSRREPGYAAPEAGRTYYRENVVQIYKVTEADKTDWFMVAPGEWIERRFIRQVIINTTPPEGVEGDRWIEVNLQDQVLSVYDNRRLIFATMIASGMPPFYTRPGAFKIYSKKPLETMQGAFEADRSDFYYLENVPWTMYYDEARALHGAYWRTVFGYPQSHGCVNLSPGDSNWLFQWAQEGDWVYVWDPSGKTPTDPSFYGPGGA